MMSDGRDLLDSLRGQRDRGLVDDKDGPDLSREERLEVSKKIRQGEEMKRWLVERLKDIETEIVDQRQQRRV